MREPFPVFSDTPHPRPTKEEENGTENEGEWTCTDTTILRGMGAYSAFNAHFIPLAPCGSGHLPFYFPCHLPEEQQEEEDGSTSLPEWDQIVVFETSQILTRFAVELANEKDEREEEADQDSAFLAAQLGEADKVKGMVARDRSLLKSVFGRGGETLAYAALLGNHLSLLQWLLEQEASLAFRVRGDGRSLAFLSVLGQLPEALALLLQAGASIDRAQFGTMAREFGYGEGQIAASSKGIGWCPWDIPKRDSHFCGRERELQELAGERNPPPGGPCLFSSSSSSSSSFSSSSLTSTWCPGAQDPVVVCVAGPQGIGKTSLAIEYLHRNQGRYLALFWIDCRDSPLQQLASLSVRLGVADDELHVEEAAGRFAEHLSLNPGWLLVLDNVPSSKTLTSLFERLPTGGHMLLLSRNQSWRKDRLFTLGGLEEGPSVRLLSNLSGRSAAESPEATSELAAALGHHPLALAQAASLVREQGVDFATCLSLLRQDLALLRQGSVLPSHDASTLHFACLLIWSALVSGVRESPSSAALLFRSLFVAPEHIPKVLVLGRDPPTAGRLEDLMAPLRAQGLLCESLHPPGFTLNPLIQNTLRTQLTKEESGRALGEVMAALRERGDLPGERREGLLPHARVLLGHCTKEEDRVWLREFLNG
jgi:hypothetical protein